MTRRSRQKNSSGLEGILFLLFIAVIGSFQSSPIITSMSCSGITVLLLFAVLLVRQKQATNRVNRVTGRQMYLDYTPRQFEKAVAELFRAQGYNATVTSGSGDGGLDILLTKDGKKYGVECKQYKDTLGPKFIRDFIGALHLRRLNAGFFVTTSGYSQQARLAAKDSEYQIILIDAERLGRWQEKVNQRVAGGHSAYTAFIPFKWWLKLSKVQKTVILLLLSVTIFVVTFAFVYIGVDAVGSIPLS